MIQKYFLTSENIFRFHFEKIFSKSMFSFGLNVLEIDIPRGFFLKIIIERDKFSIVVHHGKNIFEKSPSTFLHLKIDFNFKRDKINSIKKLFSFGLNTNKKQI